eukprot:6064023-Pleurochrysis_carterae.AAC.2
MSMVSLLRLRKIWLKGAETCLPALDAAFELRVRLNQADKLQAVEQGTLSGRLGDSATSAEAELLAIFAILRKVQAQQIRGHYEDGRARVLIM